MKNQKYIHILKSIDLFKGFSENELLNLLNNPNSKITEHNKGEIIFSEDEECKALSINLDGTIEIQKIDALGKILTVSELLSGDTFGEILIFSDFRHFPMTVFSKTNSLVLHIQKDLVVTFCQTNRTFLDEYLKILSNKAFTLNRKLKEVTLKTIRQKICEYIFMQYKNQKKLELVLPITKKEWADKLGVQRPSLSRELIKMKEENLIDYDKDNIYIKDLEGIRDYI